MTPRTTNKWARERPETRHCEVPGCGVATRAGKPFCSDHVEEHPYIQELLHKMMDREIEEARVRQFGPRAVASDGLTAQEILKFVEANGERTVPRLARDLNMDLPTLRAYVKALKGRRLIRLAKNKRGTPLIRLPKPQPVAKTLPAAAPQVAGSPVEAATSTSTPEPSAAPAPAELEASVDTPSAPQAASPAQLVRRAEDAA